MPINTSELNSMNIQYPTVYSGINRYDINNKPFNSYKLWDISSGSLTSSIKPLTAIYSSTRKPLIGDSRYTFAKNIDGSLKVATYFSVNHLFYKRKDQPFNTFGPSDTNRVQKFLYQSASIFSIPNTKVGAKIKPTSFEFIAASSPYIFNLKDDKYGNVYDVNFLTSSIVSKCVFYEGFNEYFDTTRIKYNYKNVTYIAGIEITGSLLTNQNIGYAARFGGAGFISQSINGIYSRDTDYSISFFIKPNSNTGTKLVLGKLDSINSTKYPFKIELNSTNKILFTAAAGTELKTAVSQSVTASVWNHVVCQKTGSYMYVHVNGINIASQSNPAFALQTAVNDGNSNINNNSLLYIGGFSTNSSNLTADLDEVRIFNKGLDINEINALKDRSANGTCLQTNIVGNVFHDQGMVVVSSPNPLYKDIINIPGYNAYYRSTLKTNEFSTLIKVPAGQYNMSLNPSLLKDDNETYQSFVSGSDFSPYITTIGLYNPAGILMAVAKLAQPIKKRNDIDLNFLIQIDIDQPIS